MKLMIGFIAGVIVSYSVVGIMINQNVKEGNDPILYRVQIDHSKDLNIQKAFSSGDLQCISNCSNL